MRHNWWRGIDRGGAVSLPSGLGNPTPTYTTLLAHVPIFVPPVFRFTCRPSGALGYLVYAAFYKHAAPLGLKAAMHRNSRYCIHRGGEVSSPDGLGNQPLRTVCDNTTLRSSGARGLDVSRCYRHIAPLERKAAMHRNSRYCIHRGGGEVTSSSGLGNPTPTASPFRYVVFAASLR